MSRLRPSLRSPAPSALLGLLSGGLLAACAQAGLEGPLDEHDTMPEASAPLSQSAEDGPVGEGVLEGAELRAIAAAEAGARIVDLSVLPRPAARVGVWLELAPGAEPPRVEVEAGWQNGQTAPWRALLAVHTEAPHLVLATELDTLASSLRLRVSEGGLDGVRRLRWVAGLPLEPSLRTGAVPEPDADGAARPRADWGAAFARCAAPTGAVRELVLTPVPGEAEGDATPARLRAWQALELEGLGWCDLRPSYALDADQAWTLRGARRAAGDGPAVDEAGRLSVAVLGCGVGAEASLARLLTALHGAHRLEGPARVRVAAGIGCGASAVAALQAGLDAWLGTDPFGTAPPPPPPPPPPPMPMPRTATITGRVFDASTGDAGSGAPIVDARLRCPACEGGAVETRTGADGRYTLVVPPGRVALSVEASGFVSGMLSLDVVAGQAVARDLGLQPEPPPPPNPGTVSVIDHAFLIDRWGGTVVDPTRYPMTQDGFQAYLDATGVQHFAAWEYVVPNNEAVATRCGLSLLLPEHARWPRAAALGLLADQLRRLVNEPVTLRNWWRPPCYNEGVGGAAGGDHPDADALDLDFRSARSRAAAQRMLCETYWQRDLVAPEEIAPGSNLNPRLNMSIGLGGVTIHLGLLSRNGRRFWRYDSYSVEPNSGSCW